MKKLFFSYVFALVLASASGQYVLIPDSNFRYALINQGFASCFDTTQTMLDTTCSAVLDSTVLGVANKNIRSIEGIQYFKHLNSLACDSNPLYALPLLPNSLSYLSCQFDSLSDLPQLPSTLYLLECFQNQLDSLPSLPSTVRWLVVSNNNLHTLPSLPNALYGFECEYNQLATFPPLPSGLGTFDFGYNPITTFPVLPSLLKELICDSTNTNSLPALPDSLRTLSCTSNMLSFLPPLPSTLRSLNCSINQLASLPTLPDSLVSLNCSFNQLTSIPALPDSLYLLTCGNNLNLMCLPHLNKVVNLNFENTGITCLPDTGQITHSSPSLISVPLCTPNSCYPLGIHDLNNATLKIYPNPVNDILHVDYSTQNSAITIYDISGRVLIVPITDDSTVNVSALPSGMYYIRIQNNSNNIISKFVKE